MYTPVNLTIPAATVTPQSVGAPDWRNDPIQSRNLAVKLGAAGDSVLLEGTMDNQNWLPLAAAITGDVNWHVVTVNGPYQAFRATKTGTASTATVTGII